MLLLQIQLQTLGTTPFAPTEAPFKGGMLHGLVESALTRHSPSLWASLPCGSDDIPQDGATLLLEVPALSASATATGPGALTLRGPGIADTHTLRVAGLDAAFWRARAALAIDYPRGVDLLLCCGDTLAAIPRTTRIALHGD